MPTLPDDPPRAVTGVGVRWEAAEGEVPRFVAAGDLDIDVRRRVTDILFELPPGSVPRVEIDLGAVTFLDAGTAGAVARYAEEAARHGGTVRVINATGLPRYVLRMLGLADLLQVGPEPDGDEPGRRRPVPLADVLAAAQAVSAASSAIVARSQALCRTAANHRRR